MGTMTDFERTHDVHCDLHGPMELNAPAHWWECRTDSERTRLCPTQIVYVEDAFQGGIPGVTIVKKPEHEMPTLAQAADHTDKLVYGSKQEADHSDCPWCQS